MQQIFAASRHVIFCSLVALFLVGCSSVATTPPPGLAFPDTAAHETVLRAVDGDTFELSSSGTVRLVGVDSPESVKPGAPVECHGKAASNAAARLTGKTVRVEIDDVAGERDRYGRRLVYLWYLHENTWIHYNLEAVTNGDARAYAYENQQYLHRKTFEAAEQDAIAQNAGLWACA
jgi:micrococcal nuclease